MIFARLRDPSHAMPHPDAPRLFAAEGELIDEQNSFWAALLRDGSLVEAEQPAPASPAQSPAPASPVIPAASDD